MPIEVHIARLSQWQPHWQQLPDCLSAAENARIQRLSRAESRQRFVLARVLLRTQLARQLDCSPTALTLTQLDNGKPILADHPDWCFSLSHSEDLVAMACAPVALASALGIDVEFQQRRNKLMALAAHYFSALEQQQLQALPEDAQRRQFFQRWTLKEAYAKAQGSGLATNLRGTSLDLRPEGATLALTGAAATDAQVCFWHFPLAAAGLGPYSLGLISLQTPAAAAEAVTVELRQWSPAGSQALTLAADLQGVHAATPV